MYSIAVLRNAGKPKNALGTQFEHLKEIMDSLDREAKPRVGVCLDSAAAVAAGSPSPPQRCIFHTPLTSCTLLHCVVFGVGYNVQMKADYDETMKMFDDVIGLDNLKVLFLNDPQGRPSCLRHHSS